MTPMTPGGGPLTPINAYLKQRDAVAILVAKDSPIEQSGAACRRMQVVIRAL
jgi:hypothetical protein